MGNLEKFIKNHKDSFDDYEPSQALWHRLEKKLDATRQPRRAGKLLRMQWKWMAAAAVILVIAGSVFLLTHQKSGQYVAPGVAAVPKAMPASDSNARNALATTPVNAAANLPASKATENEDPDPPHRHTAPAQDLPEEMYHYSRLIELKQKEIAVIKERNPELYQRFLKDLESLEYSYDALREKQKGGINNEQLLEAMILNLKMQANLLNKQLEVTKHIKTRPNHEKTNDL